MTPSDLALTVGATARLTRLITTDDLGQWWLRDPAYDKAVAHVEKHGVAPWWDKYRSGLDCVHCSGVWVGALVVAAHAATEPYPRARSVWRYVTGVLALNAVVAVGGSKLGYWEKT